MVNSLQLIGRDISELFASGTQGRILATLVLAVAVVSMYFSLRHSRLALASLAVLVAMGGAWWAYYQFPGIIPNPGLNGVVYVGYSLLAATMIIALILVRRRKRRNGSDGGVE